MGIVFNCQVWKLTVESKNKIMELEINSTIEPLWAKHLTWAVYYSFLYRLFSFSSVCIHFRHLNEILLHLYFFQALQKRRPAREMVQSKQPPLTLLLSPLQALRLPSTLSECRTGSLHPVRLPLFCLEIPACWIWTPRCARQNQVFK